MSLGIFHAVPRCVLCCLLSSRICGLCYGGVMRTWWVSSFLSPPNGRWKRCGYNRFRAMLCQRGAQLLAGRRRLCYCTATRSDHVRRAPNAPPELGNALSRASVHDAEILHANRKTVLGGSKQNIWDPSASMP